MYVHVWTLIGVDNEIESVQWVILSFSNNNATWAYEVPSFVGNDYFCDDTGDHVIPGPSNL